MKKVQLFALTTLLATLCAGCGGKESSGVTNSTGGIGNTSSSVHHDPVTITYSAWNLGAADAETPNLDRMMIDEFEKQYPWITVNVMERPNNPGTTDPQNWSEFLAARASVGKLPDVFMVDTLPNYVGNNWVMDITSLVNSDPDYALLSDDVTSAAVYKNMTFALPIAIYYHGYVVNKTLFYNQGSEIPTADTTFDEFINEIKGAADHTSGGTGHAGIEGIEHIIHCYPSLINDAMQWYTFDGEKFNLDSPEFRQAVDFYLSIYNDKSISYDVLTTEERIDFFGEGDPFPGGKMLAKWYGSYSLGSLQASKDDGTIDFALDFIGFPGVGEVKKTPISMDFNAVSSQTKHPEEAYLLAKWMGFGKEGYAKRLELSTTVDGLSLVSYAPLIPDQELLDKYFALYPTFKEYRKVIESQSFISEPVKYMVGYDQVRYQGTYDAEHTMYGIVAEILNGTTKLADVSTSLNKRANEIYQENLKDFNEKLEQYYITAA